MPQISTKFTIFFGVAAVFGSLAIIFIATVFESVLLGIVGIFVFLALLSSTTARYLKVKGYSDQDIKIWSPHVGRFHPLFWGVYSPDPDKSVRPWFKLGGIIVIGVALAFLPNMNTCNYVALGLSITLLLFLSGLGKKFIKNKYVYTGILILIGIAAYVWIYGFSHRGCFIN